jgi:hypothetical protein
MLQTEPVQTGEAHILCLVNFFIKYNIFFFEKIKKNRAPPPPPQHVSIAHHAYIFYTEDTTPLAYYTFYIAT